jgi:hypothetical protein
MGYTLGDKMLIMESLLCCYQGYFFKDKKGSTLKNKVTLITL